LILENMSLINPAIRLAIGALQRAEEAQPGALYVREE